MKHLSSLPKSQISGLAIVQGEEFRKNWNIWSTPLEKYTAILDFFPCHPRFNFREYLAGKLLDARKEGRVLRVLDVGVGTGRQWADIASQNKGVLDLSFTVYGNLDAVRPYFRDRAFACPASNLASAFPLGSFDIIVTHYGAHYQLTELIIGAHSLLAPGGEAVLSGMKESKWVRTRKGKVWAYEHVLANCAEYALLAVDPPPYENKQLHWFLHLKKSIQG